MLNEFLNVTYKHASAQQEEHELISMLRKLPPDELYKIATGQVDLMAKTANDDEEWLEKFKGTPLMDQAVALAQQELQIDMSDIQKREQRQMERANEPQETSDGSYIMKDKIRVQKKMLELQLASADGSAGAAAPLPPPGVGAGAPEVGAQGAGAPGPEAAPVGAQKFGSAVKEYEAKHSKKTAANKLAEAFVSFADNMGRELARADAQKIAQQQTVMTVGDTAGRVMAKTAFDWAGAGKKVMDVAKAHPGAAIGAGAGALSGLAHGLQKDERGERHLVRGALEGAAGGAVGAGLGAGAQGIKTRMAQGMPAVDALKGTVSSAAKDLKSRFQGASEKLVSPNYAAQVPAPV
jgi:hypothetical protein